MKLTLLTLPLSTNSLYAHVGRHRFLTSRAETNKEAMGWEVRSQYHGKPLEGPVRLKIALYWPDARNRDVDNIKALLDACTGILWADDGQIADLHITKAVDRKNPRVEMEVSTLNLVL